MLIEFDERASDSPLLDCIWRSETSRAGEFFSVAYPQWEIVISRVAGHLSAFVRGPETSASKKPVPGDGSWLGLRFQTGAFMLGLDYARLRDAAVPLPVTGDGRFWLGGQAWEAPTFDDADRFIARLARRGLLASDPVVRAAMNGEPVKSDALRRQQRRFIKATGLSKQAIATIERAQLAALMLRGGFSIGDTTAAAGFSDQPHLTRSLTRFIGLTPGQLLSRENDVQLSFISKQRSA